MLISILMLLGGLEGAQLQPLPSMSHLAREAMLLPVNSSHLIEWTCDSGIKSRAEITVHDVGVNTRNRTFRLELTILEVDGRGASPLVHSQVQKVVAELNSLITFEGRCRESGPGLFIRGGTLNDGKRDERRLLVDLRSGKAL